MSSGAVVEHGQSDSRRISYIQLLKQTVSEWMEDNCPRLAAALAFYTFLSIAPLMVIATKVLFLFLNPETATNKLWSQIAALVGDKGAEAIKEMTKSAGQSGSGIVATIVSFILLLFSATGVFVELQDSMNIIWEVRPKPNQGIWGFIRTRMLSVAMVFAIAFILLVSFVIGTGLTAVSSMIAPGVAALSFVAATAISLVVVTLLFAMIFKYLPDVRIEWRSVWIGAIFTAVLFELGKYGLGLYFKYGSTTSAYGAFGSLAALLLWVYYSAQLVFFGTEFTQVYAKATGHRIEPSAHAVSRSEQERIAAGIPHEQTLAAAAGQAPAPGVAHRPPHYPPAQATNGNGSRSGIGRSALLSCLGFAAGTAITYFGRGRAASLASRYRGRIAERNAALELQNRIGEVEKRCKRVSRLADRVDEIELEDRLKHVEHMLRSTARRTVPPKRDGRDRKRRVADAIRSIHV